MTDPMERLKQAMENAPEPKRRDAAREAALRAFDEEFETPPKETAAPARPTSQIDKLRSWIMSTITRNPLRPALLGGVSVAALALVIALPVAERERLNLMGAGGEAEQIAPAPASKQSRPEPNIALQRMTAMEESVSPAADAASSMAGRRMELAPAIAAAAPEAMIMPLPAPEIADRERFANADANPVKLTSEAPVSTFSIDVDTASMSYVRRAIMSGALPPAEAVRVEELINYFPYDYPAPEGDAPFRATASVMDAPWAEGRKLIHIGIRGALPAEPKRSNFTFLIDTSGSMQAPDKLPLLLSSLRLLLNDLGPEDTVAIVTYAGASGVALEPTPVSERAKILAALDRLTASGGTAGAAGIEEAYRLAGESFDDDATNRVILATDGDFNIGASSPDALEAMIEDRRETGVYLSILGFGRGNLNDRLMQALAQAGNGQAAYIDTLSEARKTLVEERAALHPIAEDVKIQVEFNPAAVRDYRLIGYETRALSREDFNNDKVDAGEIGAGHRVTAIYEITPVGGPARVDPLRYQSATTPEGDASELVFLRLRYKAPGAAVSQLIETPIPAAEAEAGSEARFATAIAGFGELLRGSPHLGDWDYEDAAALAKGAKGEDPFGYRAEAVQLMRLAEALDQ